MKAAMAGFAGNAGIITAGEGEGRTGLFCTSVIAPTMAPPRYLACIGAGASALPVIAASGCFGVCALAAGQEAIGRRFAGFGGISGGARFEGADWTRLETGAPILADAAAALDCRVEEMIDRGDYTILIGAVVAAMAAPGRPGLVWWQGGMHPVG